MALTPYNKIKLSRIKDFPILEDNTGKYIINENNNIKFVEKYYFSTFINSSDIVSNFKITDMSDNNLTYTDGEVISPIINGKQYKLTITGTTLNTNLSINEGGCADKIITKLWKQPILSSNNSSPYLIVSAQDNIENYEPWKAFNGTNIDASDCWHSTETSLPKWLQMDLMYPLIIEKFAIQNRNNTATDIHDIMLAFKIYGLTLENEWETIVDVDNINSFVENQTINSWNEYESKYNDTLYKSIKYECFASNANKSVSIGRFEIIGKYKGYRLPDTYYNIFIIGKENEENPEAKIIVTADEYPEIPEGYTYGIKLGFYKTDLNNNTKFFYPKQDLYESFSHGFVISESLGTTGYRLYSDGWKEQWGNLANPTFPIAFDNIPVIVERGATNVTTTGMTITAQNWKVEGY